MPADDASLFDRSHIDATARDHDVDVSALSAVAADHQANVESLPGVENLVYEWRKQYQSPLIARTRRAYYLAVPKWVWDEFGDALGTRSALLDALAELHRRTVVERTGADATPPKTQTYVVLDRTVEASSGA